MQECGLGKSFRSLKTSVLAPVACSRRGLPIDKNPGELNQISHAKSFAKSRKYGMVWYGLVWYPKMDGKLNSNVFCIWNFQNRTYGSEIMLVLSNISAAIYGQILQRSFPFNINLAYKPSKQGMAWHVSLQNRVYKYKYI